MHAVLMGLLYILIFGLLYENTRKMSVVAAVLIAVALVWLHGWKRGYNAGTAST